jgi:hypothetical protein
MGSISINDADPDLGDLFDEQDRDGLAPRR